MQGLALRLKGPTDVVVNGVVTASYPRVDSRLDQYGEVSDLAIAYARGRRAGTVVQIIDKGRKLRWGYQVKYHPSGLSLVAMKTGHFVALL